MVKYKLGMVCGRFQHFHEGHEALVDTALMLCEKVIIFIGSAQEKGTKRNPFSWHTRYNIIRSVYPNVEQVTIVPLDDLTSEDDITPKWGSYLLDNCVRLTGKRPDLMVYGNDESRSLWFDKKDLQGISEMIVNRYTGAEISATKLREMLVNDDKEQWEKHTHENIHRLYAKLRRELMACEDYKPKVYSLYEILQQGVHSNMEGRAYRNGSITRPLRWKILDKYMYTYNSHNEEWIKPTLTSHWVENNFVIDKKKRSGM